jgi:predicted DNA-binding transcriptional regulator AlpA
MLLNPTNMPRVPPAATKTTNSRFLDAKQVGARLACSWRHVLRMADRGLMPWGVKLGALRRWDADELEAWISGGCKPVRPAAGRSQ